MLWLAIAVYDMNLGLGCQTLISHCLWTLASSAFLICIIPSYQREYPAGIILPMSLEASTVL